MASFSPLNADSASEWPLFCGLKIDRGLTPAANFEIHVEVIVETLFGLLAGR